MKHRFDENGELLPLYKQHLQEDLVYLRDITKHIKWTQKVCIKYMFHENEEIYNNYIEHLECEIKDKKQKQMEMLEYYGNETISNVLRRPKKRP